MISRPVFHKPRSWQLYFVVLLALLAPIMGGSTEVWAQSLLMFGTGALLMLAPPRRSLGWLPNICLALLFLIALAAFLPANWFVPDEVRAHFADRGLTLPSTRTPQPWLTLEGCLLLLLGIAWTYFLFAFEWPRHWREKAWIIYSSGIVLLASTLIVGFISKQRVPFWPNVPEYGFFPNRNQTSNVLGLGGVMIYALTLQRLVERRKYWWLWLLTLPIICSALIIDYSRAGIVFFFVGALVVHLYWWRGAKQQGQPAFAFAGLGLLILLFITNGGATLARFTSENAGVAATLQDARWLIQKDAVMLLGKAPWLGIGLGNFPPLFSIHRRFSIAENDVIHPESDWLWSAIELGWIGPLLMLILFGWWIARCRPFEPGSYRLMRMAAMICGIAFVAHGFFDVSGHRIGALWPALFLGSMSIHPRAPFKKSEGTGPVFRVLGLIFILIGLWWASSLLGGTVAPTTVTAKKAREEVAAAARRSDYFAVPSLADGGLRVVPLDWWFYYQRGAAETTELNLQSAAVRDLAIARYLLPYWPTLYFEQGRIWIEAGEVDRAIEVWGESLQHAGNRAGEFYSRMLGIAQSNAEMRDRLRQLAADNHVYLTLFLQTATSFEFRIEIERILSNGLLLQSFSPNELQSVFSKWYKEGDKLELIQTLQQHPDWKKAGWRELARSYADLQDYQEAWKVAEEFGTPPRLPQRDSSESLDKLGARFLLDRTNVQNGLDFYLAQRKSGQNDAALATLRQLTAAPNAPKYLWYLEAQLWAEKGDWAKAWRAWARYELGEQ